MKKKIKYHLTIEIAIENTFYVVWVSPRPAYITFLLSSYYRISVLLFYNYVIKMKGKVKQPWFDQEDST